ncbi:MAG: RES family NAD+ phosphorylase [Thiobacillus sp.]
MVHFRNNKRGGRLARGKPADLRIVDPDDYGHAQGIGRKLRSDGVRGILYPSVRHPSGECLAAFSTAFLKNCLHAAYLEYNWNGQAIDAVFEVSQLL